MLHTVHDGIEDICQHIAEIDGDDRGRCFVRAQTMIVACAHGAQA